jgi:ATP-dependent Clp protease ATP-binding subunit ClpB
LLCKRIAKQDINITISHPTIELISLAGYAQNLGARPLKRETQKIIETALADALLSGEVISHKHYIVEPSGDF